MAFSGAFSNVFRPPFGGGAGKTRYTLTLQPDAAAGIDTFTWSVLPDNNVGAVDYFYSRLNLCVGLLKFDLSSIPPSVVIVSANIYLYWAAKYNTAGTITIYRILPANSTWTEASTWNYKTPSSVRWAGDTGGDGGADAGCNVSGTDYSATVMGTFNVIFDQVLGKEYTTALGLAEFGSMLSANSGIAIKYDTNAYASFCTSDHETAGYRPKLVVVYDA